MSRRLPDLASLELLVAVADEGGIGAAARAVGISQPSATERLRTLERRLGLLLIRRTPAGSTLTGEGTAVVGWARGVLQAAQELVDGAAVLSGQRRRHLDVGASLTVAEHLVPGWLVALAESAPDISVTLQMGNSTVVADQVRTGKVQLGFVEGPAAPAGVRSRTVGVDELVLVVAPGHDWTDGRAVGAPQVAATPLVMREAGSGTRDVLEEWLATIGLRAVPAVELASTTALVQAVMAGVGPGVVSRLAVAAELAEGRLVGVPLEVLEGGAARPVRLTRKIRAIWRGNAPTAAAAALVAVALTP
ncbi:LysR family transcriptional regulator [Georgenia thermotolerans]|uniref:LysR family transcriptional regulator n=1 Tax=Georgenia thermotolerans TaxID=527326 RepID=A0A7J5UR86_9MICO|nr:LysR substrate-binding domain-containing protein [Georgenia thermotolerans]KAE8764859.1 LysR family transcriptional regulator [Georgenia thermotolerans]